jgi:translation initiation factor 2 beta subunit (eIF-2beta)/eIF-5
MVKDNNFIKESSSIIEEIEAQLKDVLSKKKEQVEHELEEKIKAEQEEAQKRLDQIESELEGNKEALENYKNVLTQFENDKEGVKEEIKTHLDVAIQLQTDIETMTGKTLQELKTVSELTKKLEVINHEASTKVNALKTELEEKYGIVAQVPESNGHDEVDFDLENELAKLEKIKELLGSNDVVIKSVDEDVEAGGKEEEPVEAAGEEEEKEEAADEAEAESGEEAEVKEEAAEENEASADAPGDAEEKAAEKAEAESEEDAETKDADADATTENKTDESFKTAFEALDTYRKSETVEGNGYMVFYENKGKIVLDGESFVAYLNNNLEEVKKLYNKLQETESPKDQFFTKQEILKKQDVLRKYMLSFIGKGELEVSNMPQFTEDILNLDVLKNILEKVSMENWSNHDDFTSFDKLTNDLKESFYAKITPPDKYLDSIKDELESA